MEEKIRDSNIRVFPNPSTNVIELELEDYSGLESLEIYNILGEPIMTINTVQERKSIDILRLSPSTSIIKTSFDNGESRSIKFMKI